MKEMKTACKIATKVKVLIVCLYFHADESNCTDGDVRLADGRTEMKGRVEICIKGVWGAVTDTDWDYKAASVVCRQLQLPSECKSDFICIGKTFYEKLISSRV